MGRWDKIWLLILDKIICHYTLYILRVKRVQLVNNFLLVWWLTLLLIWTLHRVWMLFMVYFKSYPFNQPYFRSRSIVTLFFRFCRVVVISWMNIYICLRSSPICLIQTRKIKTVFIPNLGNSSLKVNKYFAVPPRLTLAITCRTNIIVLDYLRGNWEILAS